MTLDISVSQLYVSAVWPGKHQIRAESCPPLPQQENNFFLLTDFLKSDKNFVILKMFIPCEAQVKTKNLMGGVGGMTDS